MESPQEDRLSLRGLNDDEEGKIRALSFDEAEELQKKYGKNMIDLQKPTPWWKVLLLSFVHPFNGILFLLAIISAATGDFVTMTLMLVMIVLSVSLRFIQDLKSEVAAQALKKLVANKVCVVRKYKSPDDRDPTPEDVDKIDTGFEQEYTISTIDIVPGDIVKLSAGVMIPGDVRLLISKDLFISQSSLTGEALPVEKFVVKEENDTSNHETVEVQVDNGVEKKKEAFKKEVMDNPGICLMGTSVVSGTATAIVEKIGSSTLFGEMAKELSKKREPNAFQLGIKRVSYMFLGVMAVMVPAVLLINGLTAKNWLDSFLFAISVGVGLTPEMLPMIVNSNLARGAIVMSRKRSIVKRMDSIINLGAMDTLCTDKTGTLTQDKVVLINYYDLNGTKSEITLRYAFLNSFFQTGLKNLLDVAVIEFFERKAGRTSFGSESVKQVHGTKSEIEPDTHSEVVNELLKQYTKLMKFHLIL